MGKIDTTNLPIPSGAETVIFDNILLIKKWNWDYSDFLSHQKVYQEFIRKNKKHKIYLFTNHPHCFTLGRGNEKGENTLVDFNESEFVDIPYPLFKIHRGGGLTFHYPGQWIFYPIVSISEKYTLHQHMCWMLKLVRDHLHSAFLLKDAIATEKIMGVWLKKQKLASIGVGLNRFVTEHGLAFNVEWDQKFFSYVQQLHPCGLDPAVYQALDQVVPNPITVEDFHQGIISQVLQA